MFASTAAVCSVWILPGHPDGSVDIDLGWGGRHSGRAGNGAGFDGWLLRTSDALWNGSGVALHKLNIPYSLAITQMQQTTEHREVVISITPDEHQKSPQVLQEKNHRTKKTLTLYPHWQCKGY
ncbi:MAG: hypothetical protein M3Y24_11240 [Acidobacteriota bacterium]|nr:hypothetical protein [Acidobacteriota bacterium]